MARCYDEGTLRAFLDDALQTGESALLAAHLQQCRACRERLVEVQALAAQAQTLLGAPGVPDAAAALGRFKSGVADWHASAGRHMTPEARRVHNKQFSWRTRMMDTFHRFSTGSQRRIVGGVGVLMLAVSLLLLPPVRAAADQVLQIFRVRTVLFLPLNPERLQQLEALNFDEQTLFVAEPEIVNQPAPPRAVASVAEAAPLVGFMPRQPALFPAAPVATETQVYDHRVAQFQVNVESARRLLELMGVDDVTLPDALGAEPIVASLAPALETRYDGAAYDLTLIQGTSPTVELPDGVDLEQLGTAALRLLGMDSSQAAEVSRAVDWSSTLIFPFPANLDDVRQVTVGNTPGLLVGDTDGYHLYWQDGEQFFVMHGRGMDDGEMLAAAESVR
jgi:hypothetical protein